MTLHEHDRDLIMDVAEGALDEPADGRARTEIATCDECSTDLAELQVALAALADIPPAAMSEFEAARLTRDLDNALGHTRPTVAAGAPVRAKRQISWVPIGSIAAVLLAVVLIAPGLELLGGDADDAGNDDLSAVALEQESDGGSTADDSADEDGADLGTLEAPATAEGLDDTNSDAENSGGAGETSEAIEEGEDVPDVTSKDSPSDEPATTAADLSDDLGDMAEDASDAGVQSDELREKVSVDRYLEFALPSTDDRCFGEAADYIASPATTYTLGDITLPSTGDRVTITINLVNDTTVVLAHDLDTCAVVGAATVD